MLSFRERLSLAWRVLTRSKSGLVEYAEREFDIANKLEPIDEPFDYPRRFDDYQTHLRETIFVFSLYGHSGSSAPFGIAALNRLLRMRPLTPLTGAPDEWMDVSEYCGSGPGPFLQHKRHSTIFRMGDNTFDSDGILFRDPDGLVFSRPGTSDLPIEFPYDVPDEPRIIEVDDSGAPMPVPIKLAPEILDAIEEALPNHGAGPELRGAIAEARA